MKQEQDIPKILRGFSDSELVELKKVLYSCRYSADEVIIRQNQRATDLFIMVSGSVEIRHRPYDGPELIVGRLNSGGVFGWSAILGKECYSSTVTAVEETSLYRISGQKLQHFCEAHHETGVVLLEKMAISVAQHPAGIHEQIMKILQSAMECQIEIVNEVKK